MAILRAEFLVDKFGQTILRAEFLASKSGQPILRAEFFADKSGQTIVRAEFLVSKFGQQFCVQNSLSASPSDQFCTQNENFIFFALERNPDLPGCCLLPVAWCFQMHTIKRVLRTFLFENLEISKKGCTFAANEINKKIYGNE